MTRSGWVTLVLTSLVSANSFVSELRDIKLCELAVEASDANIGWRVAMEVLQSFRQYGMVPGMTMIIPMLIHDKGANPLALCLNTVAILFLLELDNQIYQNGLPESARAEVERQGRVKLDAEKIDFLWRSKLVHLFVLSFASLFVLSGSRDGHGGDLLMNVILLTFAGAFEQGLLRPGKPHQRAVRAALVFGKTWLCFLGTCDELNCFATFMSLFAPF